VQYRAGNKRQSRRAAAGAATVFQRGFYITTHCAARSRKGKIPSKFNDLLMPMAYSLQTIEK
jgi:hypothetical protein